MYSIGGGVGLPGAERGGRLGRATQFFKIHNESLGWLGRIAKQKPQ